MNFVVFVTTVVLAVASAEDWAYTGPTGPENWEQRCSQGKEQSPIDLPRTGNSKVEMEPFVMENYNVRPAKLTLKNNGHTVVTSHLEMHKGTKRPMVTGGGLPAKYELAQFHLHWGSNDRQGSEHTLNGEAYPMELHLVHFNTEYGDTLAHALAGAPAGSRDALAVLGVMFQVEKRDNVKLMPMLDALKPIQKQLKETPMEPFAMGDLLPRDTLSFYRYNGSLTTPGCNEVVVWTVFKDPVEISSRQMQQFRELTFEHHHRPQEALVDNFRPIQPLNGRRILDVFSGDSCTGGAISRVASPLTVVVVVSLLVSRVMY